MDHEALYRFRFEGVDPVAKQAVWNVIAADLWRRSGQPSRVLDPACGSGEFIVGVPAAERWAADIVSPPIDDPDVRVMAGRYQDLDVPTGYFDAIVFSNVLEHLASPDDVQDFLGRARTQLRSGGRVVILGPNFRYCAREYFDCADHTLVLTDVSVGEHCVAAGFEIETSLPRYIPYSFRSRLPASPRLTSAYLRVPFLWRLLGKQFLIVARSP